MDADRNGEYDAAREAAKNEVGKLAEEEIVDSQAIINNISTEDRKGENVPASELPESDQNDAPDQDKGTVDDAVNDHRLSRVKDIPKEVPIEYLKSPVNGRVFAVNEDLLKRNDLIPCDEDGKKIYDNRKIGRFN